MIQLNIRMIQKNILNNRQAFILQQLNSHGYRTAKSDGCSIGYEPKIANPLCDKKA